MSPTMETPMYVIKRDGTVKDFDISKIAPPSKKPVKLPVNSMQRPQTASLISK